MSRPASWPVALTLAGSDPSGGAGIQADLKTFAALEVHGASVLTALTAQNTAGVREIFAVPATFIRAQLEAVLDDMTVAAAKTGMLGTAEGVEAVASALSAAAPFPLVVDPVLAAGTGETLLTPDGVRVLIERLLPLATLVTPNLPEARTLAAGGEAAGRADEPLDAEMRRLARDLAARGAAGVLIKGGHAPGTEVLDLLYAEGRFTEYRRPRLDMPPTHGTGCALSAAITARLASGARLQEAVSGGLEHVQGALAAAHRFGRGRAVPDPFHRFRSQR